MKIIVMLITAWAVWSCFPVLGQPRQTIPRQHLPQISIQADQSIHIQSPEPIHYVDISSDRILGDLPLSHILRIKLLPDSAQSGSMGGDLGTLTIVGDNFIAQYELKEVGAYFIQKLPALVVIHPDEIRPLDVAGVGLSQSQMQTLAWSLLTERRPKPIRKQEDFGVTIALNSIHTVGDYIFLDVSFSNRSNLEYAVDELRFSIDDRKITKATNAQSVEIPPICQLHPFTKFKNQHRNIFVLKKITFPGSKVLTIGLTEKQLSGRTVNLRVKYRDLLGADTL